MVADCGEVLATQKTQVSHSYVTQLYVQSVFSTQGTLREDVENNAARSQILTLSL